LSRKVAFYTFGCKVNQYETEKLKYLAIKEGWDVVSFNDEPDLFFINSCAVTHVAERKARRLINYIKNHYKNAKIALAGCYPERIKLSPEELKVDFLLDNKQKWEFFGGNEDSVFLISEDRARAILKIQDGCNQFCSYCIVPYLRGRERSKSLEYVIKEVMELVARGHKEIVLTGIRLGAYGHDLGDKNALVKLLTKIFEIEGLYKVRLSSLEPMDITEELISIASHPKLCKHWHIPLQSGSDEILKKMNRKYDTKYFSYIVDKLRERVPNIAIATDIIVGYPEETDEHFEETLEFAKKIKFMKIHVFPFSPRPFTPAGKLAPLSPKIIEERKRKLLDLSNLLWEEYVSSFLSKELEVMVEEKENDVFRGTTDNYIKVEFKGPFYLKEGDYVKVILEDIDKEKSKVYAKLVKDELKIG